MRTLTILILLLLTTGAKSQNLPSYVPSTGLIGWWPFNGNVNDESTNGHHGYNNGATISIDRFGNANSAYEFDGVNDHIQVYHDSVFNFSQFSISCWINLDTMSNYLPGIISKCGANSNSGWYIFINSNKLDSLAFQGAISTSNYFDASTSPIMNNSWIHVVGTFAPNSQKIFINGVLQGNDTNSGVLANSTEDLFIGKKNGDGFWSGHIDDIGIWDRTLSAGEIQDLYNSNGCIYIDTVLLSVTDTLVIDVNFIGINPLQYEYSLKAYPNPTQDNLFIDIPMDFTSQGYRIVVKNSLGQSVYQGPLNQSQIQMDLTTWGAGGLYFLNLYDDTNNLVDVKKIVLK
jgi:hypothetical protein